MARDSRGPPEGVEAATLDRRHLRLRLELAELLDHRGVGHRVGRVAPVPEHPCRVRPTMVPGLQVCLAQDGVRGSDTCARSATVPDGGCYGCPRTRTGVELFSNLPSPSGPCPQQYRMALCVSPQVWESLALTAAKACPPVTGCGEAVAELGQRAAEREAAHHRVVV